MAQRRDRRRQRSTRRPRPTAVAPARDPRRERIRRVTIAFLLVLGLAGVLVLVAPSGADGAAAPTPASAVDR